MKRDAEVAAGTGGESVVRLSGRLPIGWANALFTALSERGISVVRGLARRTGRGRWVAELEVEPVAPTVDAAALDYLALAMQRRDPGPVVPIVLRSFSVARDPIGGEALFLDVEGEDRVGFLGGLLDRLAGLSLFPDEMRVETFGSVARDRFALRALGGLPPTETTRRALVDLLDACVPTEAART